MRGPVKTPRLLQAVALVVAVEIGCAAVAMQGCGGGGERSAEERPRRAALDKPTERYAHEPIQPLERPRGLDPAMIELGNLLYDDTRLSGDGKVACASCHVIAEGGDDGRAQSIGIGQQRGTINAPTVLNSGLNFAQFWDGRAATLEAQAELPVTNAHEMGANWSTIVEVLRADPAMVKRFGALFADGISKANITRAIAAFERSLVTVDSPFDRWLRGDAKALSADEIAGYELFKSVGCVACHQGQNVGGNMFQRFGVLGDYFKDRGAITEADYGRFNATHDENDRFVFRVPSLRMVEHTAPYFHDGSAKTLEEAVRVMARYQLGRPLEDAQVAKLVLFLKTLDGAIPKVRPTTIKPLDFPSKSEAK